MSTVTIRDIARICGVGTSTVSRAINNEPGIRPDTKERIMKTIEEYHYIPNNAARNLKMTKSKTVGLLIKGINNSFFSEMYSEFENRLKELGYDMVLREIGDDQDTADVAVEMQKENRLSGLIFLGGRMVDPDQVLDRLDIPYILCAVAMNVQKAQCSSVAIDDSAESEHAVNYLIQKGHKKIAIMAGRESDYAISNLRYTGYRKALQEGGIKLNSDFVYSTSEKIPEFTAEAGYEATKEFLKKFKDENGVCHPPFTALYAISDLLAFGAYKALYDEGIRVPDDVSVIGFDGIDMTKYMTPALTTIRQPQLELVETAVKELGIAMTGAVRNRKMIVEGTLIERDSVKDLTVENTAAK